MGPSPTLLLSASMLSMMRTPSDGRASIAARVERTLQRCVDWSQQGRHRKVLVEVERLLEAVKGEPGLTAELLIWKAQALISLGCAERAFRAASRSWDLASSPHACHLMSMALHALGSSGQSEELLRMGRELFPDAAHLSMQLAMMLADQGRLPEALDLLDDIPPDLELPDDLQVFLVGLRANLLANVGRWSEAEEALEEGLGRHPDSSLLLETNDSLHRHRDRRRAEEKLAHSWRSTLAPLDRAPEEVDEAIVNCGSIMELPELVVLAARRLWRAFLASGPVHPQAPDAWAAALVMVVLELDGRRPGGSSMARALRASPSTVRTVARRVRAFLEGMDHEIARRAFATSANPRLEEQPPPQPMAPGPAIVVPFRAP